MNLIRKIPKPPKRSTRWRSQAHCNHVRSHACLICNDTVAIEVAHVRFGSGAGIGQKPDDWLTVSLCRDCHRRQHEVGEPSFWRNFPVADAIEEFIKSSPKRAEIERKRELRS